MRSATLVRLESLLQARKLDGTLQRQGADSGRLACSTGDVVLDEAIGGGWPAGELSEITGDRSTGRTSLLIRTLAAAARRGPVALVDAVDRFDPPSAARAGLDLGRLLWVRGPAVTVEITRSAGLDPVVQQAVRAFDLIVRAGGFTVVALDLADMPVRCLRQLPAATWMRIARANEGRLTACLLLGPVPLGRSARGVSVSLAGRRLWRGTTPQSREFLGVQPALRPIRAARPPWPQSSGRGMHPS